MSRIDLNIVDRGVQGTTWIAEGKGLTADNLDDVMEQKTDNSGALNSLPTPFARFFVAREAFRRAMEEQMNSKKEAGFAYRQLVSGILDVYELLFNIKYHKNNTWKRGQKLELREWKKKENLDSLKKLMPVLYNSVEECYDADINMDSLHFLVFTEDGKDILLACTSPYTGFVTPPDMDLTAQKIDGSIIYSFAGVQYKDLHIRKKKGGEYFREIVMFEDRDQDFKNYMYNRLFSSDMVAPAFNSIKSYIRSFKDDKHIRNDYELHLVHVLTDQNNDLVINGLQIKSSDEIDINSYFNDSLIKVPYRIARDQFKSVVYQNDSPIRDYDYLLPFKPEVLSLFAGQDIDSDLHINRNSVTVILRYNGKEYSREYAIDPFRPGMGRIVDLKIANINFDLGLFPNILSYKEAENNYFKVMVIAADEDPEAPNFNIDKIDLTFFKKGANGYDLIKQLDPTTTGAQYGVLPAVIRSRQKTDDVDGGTKFYELFNSSFDAIELTVLGDKGLLIPVWKRSQNANETYTYAVDLGTSNTFMSRCKDGANNLPEMFKMERPMVNYLHETPQDNQISVARRIESSIFDKARNRIKTEFLPAIIDGTDYRFPIRTALCGITQKADSPKLFDNHNIAFFYERLMANDDQQVFTNIKWDENDAQLRVFIRELLLIIKADILQRNGDLDRTHLVWFSPLSFMGNMRSTYEEIWSEEANKILCINANQINRYSESEAPYYYFKKKNYIKDTDAVAVIDIGGGSTDFVYFKENKPLTASSVHFGCDVLWENGFAEFDNERSNGIYNCYANTLRFIRPDLEDLNVCFREIDNVKTKDIINFWLSNSEFCDIKKRLSQDFKPVFVYHLTSILYYMAVMYKENRLPAPRSIIFSGNGSKYIDNFICSNRLTLKKIVELIFSNVYGEHKEIFLELPGERKEATCYGGLYRDANAEEVPETVYQGDVSTKYETVGDVNNHFTALKTALLNKYSQLSTIYKEVLDLLKREKIIDNAADTAKYVNKAKEDMATPLNTHYTSQIKQKYNEEVFLSDSVFFLPIVDRIFEMTKL